jgi:hypothetical protein
MKTLEGVRFLVTIMLIRLVGLLRKILLRTLRGQ